MVGLAKRIYSSKSDGSGLPAYFQCLTSHGMRGVIIRRGGSQQQCGEHSWYTVNSVSGAMGNNLEVQAPSPETQAVFKCSLVCIGLEKTQSPDFSIAVRRYNACRPRGSIFVNLMEHLCVAVIWL